MAAQVVLPNTELVSRYRCTAFDAPQLIAKGIALGEVCKNILKHAAHLAGEGNFLEKPLLSAQVGLTKTFLKDSAHAVLEFLKYGVYERAAIAVQASVRKRCAAAAAAAGRS